MYHCPFIPMTDEVCLPTFTVSFPLLRWIFIREGIEIVHSHQATSAMGNEAITYAAELGLASVYTDHSLFGFDDIASIVLNRVSACQNRNDLLFPQILWFLHFMDKIWITRY